MGYFHLVSLIVDPLNPNANNTHVGSYNVDTTLQFVLDPTFMHKVERLRLSAVYSNT